MNSFTTFIPVKRQYNVLTPGQFFNYIWLASLGSLIPAYLTHDKFFKFLFCSTFLLGICIKALSLLIKKPKRKIVGEIIFETDKIIVNKLEYELVDLGKINFIDSGNYYRKYDGFTGDQESWPNGKDVCVSIHLKSGVEITVHFQLLQRHQMQDIRSQLVHYHNEDKLHFLNLIDILGIEDYNAIQIFKKSLPEGGDVKSY